MQAAIGSNRNLRGGAGNLVALAALAVVAVGCGPIEVRNTDGGSDGGPLRDGGGSDAGGPADGGWGSDAGIPRDGGFCAPCIQQSDCSAGALCLGSTGHCALDCETAACPAGSTCQAISRGKISPLHQCVPTVAACGTLAELPPSECVDGWNGYANGFFGTYCRNCHTAGFDVVTDVRAQADSVRMAIDSRSMPRGVTLDAAERLRILTWLSCGSASPPSSVH